MKTIILVSALVALIGCAAADVSEIEPIQPNQPASEEPVKRIHVLNPGEREYLSPNLIGLQNIAITNIPLTLDFINVIDAFREVVDGVRYEIVLNAANKTNNNAEIVCRLVVLEKPWLTTLWGDKVRLLQESNCTNEEIPDSDRSRKSIEEKYETNAIFSGARNELTADDMSKLESQIITSSNPRVVKTRSTTTTTTESLVPAEPEQITDSVVTDPANSSSEPSSGSIDIDNNAASTVTQDANVLSQSEASVETTTEIKAPELSDDEKKWLDDFLSVGAYNFETSLQEKRASDDDGTQSSDQESNKRVRRGLPGGVRELDAQELQLEQEVLSKSLSKLATGDGPSYTIEKVYSGTKQVVSGSLVKLDADLKDGKTGKVERCIVSLWSQPWLEENGYEVTFDCKGKEKVSHRHSRSVGQQKKGGARELDAQELKEVQEDVSKSLSKLATGDGPSYTIEKVYSGTKQVVSGSLVKLDADLKDGKTGKVERCIVSLWSQPWLEENGYEVTFDCKGKEKVSHRHSRSVEKESESVHRRSHPNEYAEKKSHKKSHRSLDKVQHLFQKFTIKYNRTYHTNAEKQMRMRIFRRNLRLIQDLNKNEMGSAKYGITEFADMTTTEYRERTGLLPREDSNVMRTIATVPNVELPKEFDWREKGVVSKVKNQGSCGSCWAFSVTGNIEGLHAVKTGKLEEYSEQELLDCDTLDSACQGGLPDNAYQAIEKIGGLELESEYPYEGRKKECHFNKALSHVKVTGAVDLPKNETALQQWLISNGPISIGINANAMQFYRGGVSHPLKFLCSKNNLDHGVLIVGYGISEYPSMKKSLPYWIIKNSWGPKWGEQGYYRVYRGDNTCGVSEMASSAVLAN